MSIRWLIVTGTNRALFGGDRPTYALGMTSVETGIDGATVVANDRSHVFHSWSAPGDDLADPRRGRRGLVVLGLRGPPLPGLLVAARQPEHRPPAPAPDRRHPGGGRPAVHHRPVLRQRRPGRGCPPHRRARPRRPGHGVLHQRRRRGDRERHAHGPPPHRTPQGPDHLPQLPRRHGGVHRRHRRPAAVAERALRRRHGQVLGAVPLPVALLVDDGGRGGRAGAPAPRRRPHGRGPADRRRRPARDRGRHERHPGTAARLPAGRPGAVRPVTAS